jgi:hypothetical protein
MINLLRGISERCAEIILPGDPDFLPSLAIAEIQAKHSKPSLKKKKKAEV